jgi:uncharacterized membrane protein YdbT with pleckstrin-like domain
MGYVNDNLTPNEKIFFIARVHPAVFFRSIVMFVMTIVLFIYGFSNAAVGSKRGFTPEQIEASNKFGDLLLCFSVLFLLYSISLGVQAAIVMFTTEFAVTNRRLIAKTGLIRRQTLEILLSKVESVSVNQNMLGRVLNFGTVTVTGTGGTRESFRAIVDPINVRKKINQIIEGQMQYQEKLSAKQAGG